MWSQYTEGLTNQGKKRKVRALRAFPTLYAQVVKLVDTLASGASGLTAVEVQVLSWAPFLSIVQ